MRRLRELVRSAALHVGNYEQLIVARAMLTKTKPGILHEDVMRCFTALRTALNSEPR